MYFLAHKFVKKFMLIDRRSKFSNEANIWFSYDMIVRLEIQKQMSDVFT